MRKTTAFVLICSLLIALFALPQGALAKPRPTLPPRATAPAATPTPVPKPAWVVQAEGGQASPSPSPEGSADPAASQDPDSSAEPEASAQPSPSPSPAAAEKANIKVPILLYHHITEEPFDASKAISMITPAEFRKHMTAIKVHYTPISLRQYYDYVLCEDGSVTLPDDPIIVTFDDGYSSNYEIAFPILKELEIPATIFIVTDTVGAQAGDGKVNYSHFTWEEAKIMQESGLIDIQSHTDQHAYLATLNQDDLVRELRRSKFLIENNLGTVCDMVAYPYGSYNLNTITAARKAGYSVQLLVGDNTSGIDYEVNMTDDGLEDLKRITVAGTMGNVDVLELIRKAMAQK